jgi:ribosomal-protein-alanine N-acetyltransferase
MLLEGKLISLREVRISDVKSYYYDWMNNPQVTKYLESRFFPQSEERIEEYVISMNANPDIVFLAIICLHTDDPVNTVQHVGNIKLGPINWIHRFADIGIVIDKPHWGKGIGTEAISLISTYAFDVLNLHKVWAGILDGNIGSIRAFAKAGFGVEARLQRQYLVDGVWTDDIIMSKFNPDMEDVPNK